MNERTIPGRQFREGFFDSGRGHQLFYRLWLHEEKKHPLLLIVHGFGEHSGRYIPFVEELLDLPVSYATLDLVGHGKSGGQRVFVAHFEDYLSDLDQFLDYLRKKGDLSSEKILLFGHSMGGEVGAYYVLKNPGRVRTLILSSPEIAVEFWIPFADRIAEFLGRCFPHAVLHNPVRPVCLTHDQAEVNQYKTDPLIQRKITLRLTGEMVRVGRLLLEQAPEIQVPLYVLVAGVDRIIKKRAARSFFDRVSSVKKQWIEFDGMYHEIFKELERKKVFRVLRSILERVAQNTEDR